MSSITEKQRQARQKAAQQAIYESTLEVVSRSDFDGLKMQDIASEVGIATGTLYNYFKSKEDLVYYVDRRLKDVLHATVREISLKEGPGDKRLAELVRAIFEFFDKYHVVFDLAERFGAPERTPVEDRRAFFDETVANLEKIISDGVEQGRFRAVNVRRTATVLFETLVGVCKTHKYLNDFDFSRSKRDVLGMFEDYLRVD